MAAGSSFNDVQDERMGDFRMERMGGGGVSATVLPAASYRHSRVSGNPEMPDWQWSCLTQYRRDSRLRGNDGKRGGRQYVDFCQYRPGFPLAREGRLRGGGKDGCYM